jgi:hypothetical protein
MFWGVFVWDEERGYQRVGRRETGVKELLMGFQECSLD